MTENPLHAPRQFPAQTRWVQSVGLMIFFSRWLQAPLYIGLIVAQLIYVVVFVIELVALGEEVWASFADAIATGSTVHIEEATIMLGVLGLIDVVMIANLLIMVIIGGYETFVSKIAIEGHPDQPEWLSHVNANVLKVKLAMAIVGISSIHLLKTFIEVGNVGERGAAAVESDVVEGESLTWDGVLWQVVIHMVFILSAIALAWIDRMSQTPIPGAGHGAAELTVVPHGSGAPSGTAPTTPALPGGASTPALPAGLVVPDGYVLVPVGSAQALQSATSPTLR